MHAARSHVTATATIVAAHTQCTGKVSWPVCARLAQWDHVTATATTTAAHSQLLEVRSINTKVGASALGGGEREREREREIERVCVSVCVCVKALRVMANVSDLRGHWLRERYRGSRNREAANAAAAHEELHRVGSRAPCCARTIEIVRSTGRDVRMAIVSTQSAQRTTQRDYSTAQQHSKAHTHST